MPDWAGSQAWRADSAASGGWSSGCAKPRSTSAPGVGVVGAEYVAAVVELLTAVDPAQRQGLHPLGNPSRHGVKDKLLGLPWQQPFRGVNLIDKIDIAAGANAPDFSGLGALLKAAIDIPDFRYTVNGGS